MGHERLMFMVNVGKYIPYVDSLENEFYRSERFCVFFSKFQLFIFPLSYSGFWLKLENQKNQPISMVRYSFWWPMTLVVLPGELWRDKKKQQKIDATHPPKQINPNTSNFAFFWLGQTRIQCPLCPLSLRPKVLEKPPRFKGSFRVLHTLPGEPDRLHGFGMSIIDQVALSGTSGKWPWKVTTYLKRTRK